MLNANGIGFYYNSGTGVNPNWLKLVAFTDLSTARDHDWYATGSTNPSDDITTPIYTLGNVGIKEPEALADLHVGGVDGILVTGTFGAGQFPAITLPGTRMFFNPRRAAFRGGRMTINGWGDDDIGDYSFSWGLNTSVSGTAAIGFGQDLAALGAYCTAFGQGGGAVGDYSFAHGNDVVSFGDYSFAFGNQAISFFPYAYTFGRETNASGNFAHAIGDNSTAQAEFSFARGLDNLASGKHSNAIGSGNIAGGLHAHAYGDRNQATFDHAHASGLFNIASSNFAYARGSNNMASGEYSIAIGDQNSAGAEGSYARGINNMAFEKYASAWGESNSAVGQGATAWGSSNSAEGSQSTAWGTLTQASGSNSSASGDGSKALSFCEVALGSYNTEYIPNSTTELDDNDRLLVIGNGDVVSGRRDALVLLKNSYLGLGISNPAFPLTMGSGAHVTAAGTWVNASDSRLKKDVENLNYGLKEVMQLEPVRYIMKSNEHRQIGFIAQSVMNIIPEVVSGLEDDLLGISYGNLVPVLTNAIQEQQNLLNSQQHQLDQLKLDNAELRMMIYLLMQ